MDTPRLTIIAMILVTNGPKLVHLETNVSERHISVYLVP